MKIIRPYKIKLAPTLDEHWYEVFLRRKSLGIFPSSSTITKAYPQSAFLTKWIADEGWDNAQKKKEAGGARGTAVHKGIDALIGGEELSFVPGWLFHAINRSFTLDEWSRLNAWLKWYNDYSRPEIIASEMPIFSKKYGYAGTLDRIYRIDNKYVLYDDKTSGTIYDHFKLQIASYANAVEEMTDIEISEIAVLQLGAKNKNNYRVALYPDWRDHFQAFLNVFETWKYDRGYNEEGFKPPVLDLPEILKL